MLAEYLPTLLFLIVATGIGISLMVIGRFIGPRRPDAQKLSPYECGFDWCLVPKGGLEPPRLSSLPPQGSASTNSATWANVFAWACPSEIFIVTVFSRLAVVRKAAAALSPAHFRFQPEPIQPASQRPEPPARSTAWQAR